MSNSSREYDGGFQPIHKKKNGGGKIKRNKPNKHRDERRDKEKRRNEY